MTLPSYLAIAYAMVAAWAFVVGLQTWHASPGTLRAIVVLVLQALRLLCLLVIAAVWPISWLAGSVLLACEWMADSREKRRP